MNRKGSFEVQLLIILKGLFQIIFNYYYLIYVHKTWRTPDVLWHTERETHSFPIFDIRILTNDYYSQVTEWHVLEGIEDKMFGREYCLRFVLFVDKLIDTLELVLAQVVAKWLSPISQL